MIQKAEVVRTEDGQWWHPDLPDFDGRENISMDEWNEWCATQNIRCVTVALEYEDSELSEKYFEADDHYGLIAEWNPVHDEPGAFLLYICETEDGPLAGFAIPLNPDSATQPAELPA